MNSQNIQVSGVALTQNAQSNFGGIASSKYGPEKFADLSVITDSLECTEKEVLQMETEFP